MNDVLPQKNKRRMSEAWFYFPGTITVICLSAIGFGVLAAIKIGNWIAFLLERV